MSSLKLFTRYFLNQQPADGPVKQDDFEDMYLEPVNVAAYYKALKNSGYDYRVLETITYKKQLYEVIEIEINPGAKKRLLVFGGVHGNEFAAALSIIDLLQDIKQHPKIYKNCNVRIITPLNPVGFVHQSRYNESGRDINRDFKDFATDGGKLQKKVIESFKPDFLITMHEGPQDGFFVVAESDVPRMLRSKLVSNLKVEGIQLAKKNFLRFGIGEGYWQKQRFFYAIQKLLGIYTLGRYSHELGIPQLTTESPWTSRDIKTRRRPHVVTVRMVVKLFYSS